VVRAPASALRKKPQGNRGVSVSKFELLKELTRQKAVSQQDRSGGCTESGLPWRRDANKAARDWCGTLDALAELAAFLVLIRCEDAWQARVKPFKNVTIG
jgi:hypothetical protein